MKSDVRGELPNPRDVQAEMPSKMRSEMPPWQRPTVTKMLLAMTQIDAGSGTDASAKTNF